MKYVIIIISYFLLANSYAQTTENDSIFLEQKVHVKKKHKEHKELLEAIQAKDYKLANELLYELRTEAFVLNKNGFFVDAMVGFTTARVDSLVYNDASGVTGTIRFGSKFYLKKNEHASYGVQITYARYDLTMRANPKYISPTSLVPRSTMIQSFSIANVGFTSVIRIGQLTGVEMNFDVGHNTIVIDDIFLTGYNINPNLKFRYRKFAFGVDYKMAQVFGETKSVVSNTLSFSLGAKF